MQRERKTVLINIIHLWKFCRFQILWSQQCKHRLLFLSFDSYLYIYTTIMTIFSKVHITKKFIQCFISLSTFFANFTHYSVFLTNTDEWIHYGLVLTMFVVAFVITVGLLWVVLITLRVRSKYGDPKIHKGNTYTASQKSLATFLWMV